MVWSCNFLRQKRAKIVTESRQKSQNSRSIRGFNVAYYKNTYLDFTVKMKNTYPPLSNCATRRHSICYVNELTQNDWWKIWWRVIRTTLSNSRRSRENIEIRRGSSNSWISRIARYQRKIHNLSHWRRVFASNRLHWFWQPQATKRKFKQPQRDTVFKCEQVTQRKTLLLLLSVCKRMIGRTNVVHRTAKNSQNSLILYCRQLSWL